MRQMINPSAAKAINLVVPGVGLVMIGHVWTGVLLGVLFAICANTAVASSLLMPDDFPDWLAGLAIGLTGGTYIGAQFRFSLCLKESERATEMDLRDKSLREVMTCLASGNVPGAVDAIEEIVDMASRDLLVAYRVAQVLTASGDVDGGLEAWERVRLLDHHHLYRTLRLSAVEKLENLKHRS